VGGPVGLSGSQAVRELSARPGRTTRWVLHREPTEGSITRAGVEPFEGRHRVRAKPPGRIGPTPPNRRRAGRGVVADGCAPPARSGVGFGIAVELSGSRPIALGRSNSDDLVEPLHLVVCVGEGAGPDVQPIDRERNLVRRGARSVLRVAQRTRRLGRLLHVHGRHHQPRPSGCTRRDEPRGFRRMGSRPPGLDEHELRRAGGRMPVV